MTVHRHLEFPESFSVSVGSGAEDSGVKRLCSTEPAPEPRRGRAGERSLWRPAARIPPPPPAPGPCSAAAGPLQYRLFTLCVSSPESFSYLPFLEGFLC